jgi:spore coat polysaccharide biosynthesis predicted glycosyltransferase SpsG
MVNAWLHDHHLVNRMRSRRATALMQMAIDHSASSVVIDGPTIVRELVPDLVARGVRVAVIDDDGDLPFAVDTVINHNVHAPQLADKYKARQLLLGRNYAMLRRDIRRLTRGSCKPSPSKRLRVVVTCGGSDPVGATARIVRHLPSSRPLDVVVLAGPGYRDNGALHTAAATAERRGHTVDIHRAPADPGALFVTADAAISAAGGTLSELAFLGCPALAFAIVDNQVAPAAAQAALGLIAGGTQMSAQSDDNIRLQIEQFLSDDALRGRLRAAALATIDGGGPGRVIAAL